MTTEAAHLAVWVGVTVREPCGRSKLSWTQVAVPSPRVGSSGVDERVTGTALVMA